MTVNKMRGLFARFMESDGSGRWPGSAARRYKLARTNGHMRLSPVAVAGVDGQIESPSLKNRNQGDVK